MIFTCISRWIRFPHQEFICTQYDIQTCSFENLSILIWWWVPSPSELKFGQERKDDFSGLPLNASFFRWLNKAELENHTRSVFRVVSFFYFLCFFSFIKESIFYIILLYRENLLRQAFCTYSYVVQFVGPSSMSALTTEMGKVEGSPYG